MLHFIKPYAILCFVNISTNCQYYASSNACCIKSGMTKALNLYTALTINVVKWGHKIKDITYNNSAKLNVPLLLQLAPEQPPQTH